MGKCVEGLGENGVRKWTGARRSNSSTRQKHVAREGRLGEAFDHLRACEG